MSSNSAMNQTSACSPPEATSQNNNNNNNTGLSKHESPPSADKMTSFRKRRLSLPRHHLETPMGDESERTATSVDDEKAQTFRKRRLSLNSHGIDDSNSVTSMSSWKKQRRYSEASNNSSDGASGGALKSRIVHAGELIHAPMSPSLDSNHVLYQQAMPRPNQNSHSKKNPPQWKKRHHPLEDKKLPFPRHVLGTFSCHGVEPVYDSDYDNVNDDDDADEDWALPKDSTVRKEEEQKNTQPAPQPKVTTMAKINQDRGGVAFPYGNCPRTALFAVYDGHGQGGELVSQFSLHEIQHRLEQHQDFTDNVQKAFSETFLSVDQALIDEPLIEPLYAGTTACVVLLRDNTLTVANVGDSRAVLASFSNEHWKVVDLSQDQNPDVPAEQARIEQMGGYVSPSPEPGLSARVWLDSSCTQIGLAMARSIGDHAVKSVGVIADPVVTQHTLVKDDEFMILASDGVWEFISSRQAVEIVAPVLKEKGATKACQALMEAAAARWHEEEGDYRDDITALVIHLGKLWSWEEASSSSKPKAPAPLTTDTTKD